MKETYFIKTDQRIAAMGQVTAGLVMLYLVTKLVAGSPVFHANKNGGNNYILTSCVSLIT